MRVFFVGALEPFQWKRSPLVGERAVTLKFGQTGAIESLGFAPPRFGGEWEGLMD